jgi:hypothetical protein
VSGSEFLPNWSREEIDAVIRRDDPSELLYVPIVATLNCTAEERAWAEAICIQLSQHSDRVVRGNAILGFGHLARNCGKLNEGVVRPIIELALRDHTFHATDAADDCELYLGWKWSGKR